MGNNPSNPWGQKSHPSCSLNKNGYHHQEWNPSKRNCVGSVGSVAGSTLTLLGELAPTPKCRGYFKTSFSWRQSLTLGRIWIKAPIRIQVPRLPIGHSLQNGLFLQNRSNPILGHYHLKTLPVFPLRKILLAALTTSHVGNIGLPPPHPPETTAG